mmetsp:Transcript_34133/g.88100  ORF Transcript_34133/g.88100 Transcript_34133/m.88100 type:complete len:279 (-) Transcript_34133:214-1050(-)
MHVRIHTACCTHTCTHIYGFAVRTHILHSHTRKCKPTFIHFSYICAQLKIRILIRVVLSSLRARSCTSLHRKGALLVRRLVDIRFECACLAQLPLQVIRCHLQAANLADADDLTSHVTFVVNEDGRKVLIGVVGNTPSRDDLDKFGAAQLVCQLHHTPIYQLTLGYTILVEVTHHPHIARIRHLLFEVSPADLFHCPIPVILRCFFHLLYPLLSILLQKGLVLLIFQLFQLVQCLFLHDFILLLLCCLHQHSFKLLGSDLYLLFWQVAKLSLHIFPLC